MIRKSLSLILFGFLYLSLITCATKGSPGGGPFDRTPPEIVSTFPTADSTNVGTQIKFITVEFSERMDEGSLSKALFISPPLDYKMEWKRGRKLELSLNDTLQADQTYVVSIGSDAADERQNKMAQSYQLAFSTGPKIDQGSISGKVYELQKNEVVSIFAYPLSDTAKIDPSSKKPVYVSQSGEAGHYRLNYLKPARYRLFASQDQNNNLLVDANYERLGLPYRDVILNENRLTHSNLNFRLTKLDTIAPFVSGVRPINESYLQLRLSEAIKLDGLTRVHLLDSLSLDTLLILGLSKNLEADNVLDIFTMKMDTSARYQARVEFLEDTSGNVNQSIQTFSFRANSKADTTRFKLIEFIPQDSAKAVRPDGAVSLKFSRPAKWETVQSSFNLFTADSVAVPGVWKIKSIFEAVFSPDSFFLTDSSYKAIINPVNIKDRWGKTLEDSLSGHYFSIISGRELGEISGHLVTPDTSERNVFLSLKYLDGKIPGFQQRLEKSGHFFFPYLPAGKYILSGFMDLDSNGQFTAGNLFPFQFAEPFFVLEDTLKVRKRWETQGISVPLPILGED